MNVNSAVMKLTMTYSKYMINYTYKILNKDHQFVAFIRECELDSMISNFKDGYFIKAETNNMPLQGISFIRNIDELDAWYAQIDRRHWKKERTISFLYDLQIVYKATINEYLTENIRDVTEYNLNNDHLTAVIRESNGNEIVFHDEEALDNYLMNYRKPQEVNNAVDPKHYKGYVDELQWLDTMSRIPTLRDPAKFEAAVELQIRKYLDRNGQKDDSLQELQKALWYLKYLIAYKKAGRPIKVGEVESIL